MTVFNQGDPVIIIYNCGWPDEWIATTAVKNVGSRYITVCDYPDRFSIETMRHRHSKGYGFDALVHRDSKEGKQAVTRERLRRLEIDARGACWEFWRQHNEETRKAALEALQAYDEAMNEVNK